MTSRPRWMSLSEACQYARRGRSTMLRLISEGAIAAHKPDGKWVVDADSIDKYLTGQERALVLDITRRMLHGS